MLITTRKVAHLWELDQTNICNLIKQNESEVGSNMLLVSNYFYTSNISQ